jgi:malonyl-CoA/methylmalonyl-CoA synthetase
MADRATFVVPHGNLSDNVLPNDPVFSRLLTLAHSKTSGRVLIRDLNSGVEANVHNLLSDVLHLRRVMVKSLPPRSIQDLQQRKDVFISVTATGGYEFAVGILAILALKACAVLLSTAMPPEELVYYVEKSHSAMMLSSAKGISAAKQLERRLHEKGDEFVALPITSTRFTTAESHTDNLVPLSDMYLSSDAQPDPNKPGIIIFTSGTTGPPKAVVLRRSCIGIGAQSLAGQLDLQPVDTLLHLLPVHHATGVNLSFFPFLQAGACIEFKPGGFDSQWTWDRWRRGDLTHFTGIPTIYTRLMRHYEQHIATLSPKEQSEYREGAARIKIMFCGTSALPQSVDHFWRHIRQGRPILQRYGSTETQIAISMPLSGWQDVPEGSVGKACVGVDVKIAGVGDEDEGEGELLIKSPHMFSCYLNDEEATRKAHDENGYYKTGDIAKKQGPYWFILGRASIDILKSGGYKISALDIERELLTLPYVNEAVVVGVPDDEFGQRVAAVLTMRKGAGESTTKVSLATLRKDLRPRLAGYKLPTLLRVVDGELPRNATGKVVKKTLAPLYFPTNYEQDGNVQVWQPRTQKGAGVSKL